MPPAWRMDSRRLARPVEGFTTSFGAPWTAAAGTEGHSVSAPAAGPAPASCCLLPRAASRAQALTAQPRGTEGLQPPCGREQLPRPAQRPSSLSWEAEKPGGRELRAQAGAKESGQVLPVTPSLTCRHGLAALLARCPGRFRGRCGLGQGRWGRHGCWRNRRWGGRRRRGRRQQPRILKV